MIVNVIVERGDIAWIGGRLARELVARLPSHGIRATINGTGGDLAYHQIVYGSPVTRPAVGMFTHGRSRPYAYGRDYDGTIALNPAMLGYLITAQASNPIQIDLPVDDRFIKRPIVFGVAGRVYGDGRKGEHLVKAMVEAGYTVRAWGHGWPCPIVGDKVDQLPTFYAGLDYYIDTSSDEGGCVPALECLAMGKPVISHSLGVDRPVLTYATHDWPSLERVLYKLTHPRTYDDWARDHAAYFKRVMREKE